MLLARWGEARDKWSLLCYFLSACFCVTSATDVNPVIFLQKKELPPQFGKARNLHYSATDPLLYSEFSDRISIFLDQSDTSWLDVRWEFHNSSSSSSSSSGEGGAALQVVSQATCDLPSGRIVSDLFNGTVNYFRFSHLMSDTDYTVCVVVTETKPEDTVKRMYTKCAYFRTIPLIRPDSVVGLVLTLGYLLGTSICGYAAWKWRMRRIEGRKKREDDMELTSRSNGGRFSDIEERTYLNSYHPSSSYKTQEFI